MLRRLVCGVVICLVMGLGTQAVLLLVASADAPTGAKALFQAEGGTTFPAPSPARDSINETSATPRRPPASSGATTAGKAQGAPAQRSPWLGIAYWIELQRGNGLQRIADPTNFPFRSDDRIRLYVQSNRQGYLYIVNRGSSGQESLLYPRLETTNQFNWIEARKTYVIPENAWIRFDNQPGEEHLLLLLAPNPIPGLLNNLPASPTLTPATSTRFVEVASACGTKDLQVCSTKDLVMEKDETLGQQATYVGGVVQTASENPAQFSLISHWIRLLHR